MKKLELEEAVQVRLLDNPTLTVVEAVTDEITAQLEAGNEVVIRGFGRFSMRKFKAKVARNPKTGESVQVPEKWKAMCKLSDKIVLQAY